MSNGIKQFLKRLTNNVSFLLYFHSFLISTVSSKGLPNVSRKNHEDTELLMVRIQKMM